MCVGGGARVWMDAGQGVCHIRSPRTKAQLPSIICYISQPTNQPTTNHQPHLEVCCQNHDVPTHTPRLLLQVREINGIPSLLALLSSSNIKVRPGRGRGRGRVRWVSGRGRGRVRGLPQPRPQALRHTVAYVAHSYKPYLAAL